MQSMLFAYPVDVGMLSVRHPSLAALPLASIWRCFTVPHSPSVYVIVSSYYTDEDLGSTCDWVSRLYSHARHILLPGLTCQRYVHSDVHYFRFEYDFIPIRVAGGGFMLCGSSRHVLAYSRCAAIRD